MAVTDLTGTKWVFNGTITAEAGYGNFSLEAETSEISDVWSRLWVGYTFDPMERPPIIPAANSLVWMNAISAPQEEFTITGGTDATNATLIAWLEANAEQIIEPTGNEYTLTQNLTNLTSGNITLTITPDEGYSLPAQADIVVTGGSIVSYDDTTGELVVTAGTTAVEVTCESAVSTISFTIIDIHAIEHTYQAEAGMTWAEWCASEYNTDDYYVDFNRVYGGGGGVHVEYNNIAVAPSDTIVANRVYEVAGGGSND